MCVCTYVKNTSLKMYGCLNAYKDMCKCVIYIYISVNLNMYICIYPGALCTHALIFLVFRSSFGTNNLYNSFVGPPKGELRNILIISYHIKISLLISATHDGAKKPPGPNISKPVYTFEKKHVGCTYSCFVGGWIDICQAQMKENNNTTTLYQGDCRDKHYSVTHIFSYLVPSLLLMYITLYTFSCSIKFYVSQYLITIIPKYLIYNA